MSSAATLDSRSVVRYAWRVEGSMRSNLAPLVAGFLLGCAMISGCNGNPNPVTPQLGRADALIQDSAGSPTVSGTLSGNIFASVWDGDRWVDLGSPNGITIPLQVADRVVTIHGEQSVPAVSYSRVRIVLQGVTARLASGSMIGGMVLVNEASLALGGADHHVDVVIQVPAFSVEADTSFKRTIVFELFSQQWLTPAALQAGRVDDGALRSAMKATTRLERR